MADNSKLDYIQERVDTVVDRVADLNKTVEGLKATFEHHIKQDEHMQDELTKMSSTMQANTLSLQEHMRRTNLLEDYVKSVEARFSPIEMEQLRKKAVQNWISVKLKFIAKLGGAITAAGAIGMAAKHFLLTWLGIH